jgi:hypothetical protein
MWRVLNRGWVGFLPMLCLAVGAGAGAWFAHLVGAFETPFALIGAAGGYLFSGALLRRVYSDRD